MILYVMYIICIHGLTHMRDIHIHIYIYIYVLYSTYSVQCRLHKVCINNIQEKINEKSYTWRLMGLSK